jgi:hypothetical protein
MSDTKDERVERLERAAKEWHAAWVAEPALEVIRELQAELRLRDDVPEGHGWLSQGEWQRLLDVQKRRAEAAERRADALEQALRKLDHAGRMQHEVWGASQELVNALLEARAALAQQEPDQPADAGETFGTGDWCCFNINGSGKVRGRDQPCNQCGEGEPSCCARTREAKPYHEPESSRRNPDPAPDEMADPLFDVIWQVIKGWDVDTDGAGYHGATGNEAAAILRAIRRTGDTGGRQWCEDDVFSGEPSCCAQTREDERERCAQIAETENDAHVVYDDWRSAPETIAAAIRRTDGDTP